MADTEKKAKRAETEEERKARKERERAERKATEKADGGEKKSKKDETEEERKARKERERAERKAKEKAEASKDDKKDVTDDARSAKKDKARRSSDADGGEKKSKKDETEEERKARKERERAERKAKEKAEATAEPSSSKKDETEEERKVRKEKERAERKQKEKAEKKRKASQEAGHDDADTAEHHRHNQNDDDGPPRTGNELLDALAEENRSAARQASKRKDDDSRSARRQEEEAHEKEAAERREQRRAEREARKEEKRRNRSGDGASGDRGDRRSRRSHDNDEDEGEAGIDTRSLQRQGYRAQFEKDMARATALRRLVDLDDVSTVVMDAAPQSEYERYIRGFSSSGLQQVAVQCPPEESRVTVEVQAERVKHKTRTSQVPDDLGLYPEQFAELNTFHIRGGGEGDDDKDGGEASNNNKNNAGSGASGAAEERRRGLNQPVDAAALGTFLNRVFPVMNALLDERSTQAAATDSNKAKASTSFSSSHVCLACSGTLNRPVLSVRFSLESDQYLVVLYGGIDGPGPAKDLDRYNSVILLWNVYDTSAPERALVSFSRLTCICPSPTRPHLIYAGTEDGCVCVWDLREPDRQHHTTGRFQRLVCRLPSYTTSWQAENHQAAVRRVAVPGYNAVLGARREDHEQLASVDENGGVRFWIANDREKGRANGISESDHGQNMFATVRLYPSTAKHSRLKAAANGDGSGEDGAVDRRAASSEVASGGASGGLASSSAADGAGWCACATDIDFAPADPSHYIVAMADGVHHVNRYGSVAAPALYGPSTHFFDTPAVVPSCARYSTLDSRVLLVGYEDGTVRLYDDNAAYPQLVVSVSHQRIVQLCCSPTTKWMTWALDSGSNLFLLDHARRTREVPVLSECVEKPDTGACLCMDMPREDHNERRRLALGFEKGIVQLHTLDPTKTLSSSADREVNWL